MSQISRLSSTYYHADNCGFLKVSVDGIVLSHQCDPFSSRGGEIFFDYVSDDDWLIKTGEWSAFAARPLGGYVYWLAGAAGSLPSDMPWYFIFNEGEYMATLPVGGGNDHVPLLDGLWAELLAVSIQLPRKEDVLFVLPVESEQMVKAVFEYWATTFAENCAWWISYMLGGSSRLSRIRAEVQSDETRGVECEVYLNFPGTPSMRMWVKDNPDGLSCGFIDNPWIPITFAGIGAMYKNSAHGP